MIKNEHQYRITKRLTRELLDAVDMLPTDKHFLSMKPLEQKAYSNSLRRQLDQLQNELEEYDSLKGGNFDFSQAHAIKNVPALLIKMRIASGIKQEDLAKRLKLKKQQIQQYESTDYAKASLGRVLQVLEALTEVKGKNASDRTTRKQTASRTGSPAEQRKARTSTVRRRKRA